MKQTTAYALIFIFLFHLSTESVALEKIYVSSSVKNFELAEESSYLLQCLAANTGKEIEFAQNTQAMPRIVLSEANQKLKIEAFGSKDYWSETTPREEIASQCNKLELILSENKIPAPEAISSKPDNALNAAPIAPTPSWIQRNKTWLYISGGLALVAGSYFLIRSRQESSGYGSVRPELP